MNENTQEPNLISDSQWEFYFYVQKFNGYYSDLFDWQKRLIDEDYYNNWIGVASSGEVIVTHFLLNLWLGVDRYPFEFIDSAKSLDSHNRALIMEWYEHPFYP